MAMKVTGHRSVPSPPAAAAMLGVLVPAHVWVWTRTPPGTR
jgi:hypothetical protein